MTNKKTDVALVKQIIEIVDSMKMTDIQVYDNQKTSVMFDYVVIASCTSMRQAYAVHRDMRKLGIEVQGVEGQGDGEWLLADCGSVIVHMMLPKIRAYFNLEELYQGLELNPSELKAEEKSKKKTPAKKAVAKKKSVKKTVKKTVAKKIVAKKAEKKATAKKSSAKKVAKKTPTKKK